MGRLLISLIFLSLIAGCKAEQEKSRSESYVPAAQQCTTSTDSDCVGAATAGISIPLPEMGKKQISGKCEMVVAGEKIPRPCSDIQLIVRSSRENEVRNAIFDGENFRF